MPLADQGGAVARLTQRLRQQKLVRREAVAAARGDHAGLQAIAQRIAARHQSRAGRGAHALRIELMQLRTPGGEFVEIGRADVRAVEADIRETEIVGHDVENVRARGPGRAGLSGEQRQPGHRGEEGAAAGYHIAAAGGQGVGGLHALG